ncbi:MAG TPA: phospholipid carrier-dependent glycosyltransferase [Candidatus Sulfotelmatobacter sp.]|nr:phospholipid carrier-dependent glycosyltransferase [Candidatus Sulfotelmatobacter sp.]
MQTGARLGAKAVVERTAVNTPLIAILAVGLVVRLLLLGSEGFHNDIAAFESWAITLRDHAPWQFYANSGFADYPPGYFIIEWVIGHVYGALLAVVGNDPGYSLLRTLVKLPAIAMDLVDAAVVFAIARRWASPKVSLWAAAALALNPAAIYISAAWGQIDSVSWGLVLIAIWLLLRSQDDPATSRSLTILAWLAFAFSILIKPQAATVGFIMLAFPFATTDAATRARRLRDAAAGVGAGLLFGLAVALLFHPAPDVVPWLLKRYAFGSTVYPYTSVNAFTIYVLVHKYWQPDTQPLTFFGLALGPLWAWGIALVAAASALVVGRYLQRRDERAFVEGAMLLAFAFFVLATRMHERYVYGAFLLAIPLIGLGRIGIWSTITLTLTMGLNLIYSLTYQTVLESKIPFPGVDAYDLWPFWGHFLPALNVLLFFVLAFRYFGTETATAGATAAPPPQFEVVVRDAILAAAERARRWFSPREGIATLTRLDALLLCGFVVVAFVIAVIGYSWPHERIFDEIYFARAGEEYLRGVNQFEWTHPPFTKLVIALSMLLFGGLHGEGNTSYGWRFLNIVIGALEVGVVYAFAKRLTASTVFAALAALMLTFDGFHFVESRLATGEITIATLITVVLYALYRLWLATQIRIRAIVPARFGWPFWITLAIGIPVSIIFSWWVNLGPANHIKEIASGITSVPSDISLRNLFSNVRWTGVWSHILTIDPYTVAFLYAMLGIYVLARVIVPRFLPTRGSTTSYADGTQAVPGQKGTVLLVPPRAVNDPAELKVTTTRDGALRYATPDGTADFTPDGIMRVDGAPVVNAKQRWIWLTVLAISAGLLVASKWNGLFDLIVIAVVLGAVWAQRYVPGRAQWGNPRGFTLDADGAVILFAVATAYWVAYIPFFLLGHNLADMLYLQQQMFWYHTSSVSAATHPYESKWWQWPILQVPISYYYSTFGAQQSPGAPGSACCVAEILALPNPLVFLMGLISVPYVAYLAWQERDKGYALLVAAYLIQWLPWTRAPRLLFEYHFFPNLVIIVLCDAILVQRFVRRLRPEQVKWYLGVFAAAVVALFAFFYPVLAGTKITHDQWYARMWPDELHIPHTSWILPPH